MGDDQLLRLYLQSGSEDAFRQLVERHASLVYGAARRRVKDPHVADDILQAVFIAMLLKARPLSRRPSLVGWLLKATEYAAIDALRGERARQKHEHAAAAQVSLESDPDLPVAVDAQLAPLRNSLDQAMLGLSESQRSMLAMRFFEDLSYAEIAERLRMSAEAVRKRIERAVQRLRRRLERQGLALSTAALLAGITTIASQAKASTAAAVSLAQVADGVLSSQIAGQTASAASQLATALLRHMWRIHAAAVLGGGAAVVCVGGLGIALIQGTGRSNISQLSTAQPSQITVVAPDGPVPSAVEGTSNPTTAPAARPPETRNSLYHLVTTGIRIPNTPFAEPGIPVHLDFLKLPDGHPSPFEPPLDVQSVTFLAQSSPAARGVILRLAGGETLTVPFGPDPTAASINYTTLNGPEYKPQYKSDKMTPVPRRPMSPALREDLRDGVLDAQAWLDARETGEPGEVAPQSLMFSAMLIARRQAPAGTQPATAPSSPP